MYSRIYVVIDKLSDYLDLDQDSIAFQKPIDYITESNLDKDYCIGSKIVFKDRLHFKRYTHPDT